MMHVPSCFPGAPMLRQLTTLELVHLYGSTASIFLGFFLLGILESDALAHELEEHLAMGDKPWSQSGFSVVLGQTV